jgi:hypothetical protein
LSGNARDNYIVSKLSQDLLNGFKGTDILIGAWSEGGRPVGDKQPPQNRIELVDELGSALASE